MLPLTEVSSMYGMGMFIDGEELAVLEKPNDLACRTGSDRTAGTNLDRSILINED